MCAAQGLAWLIAREQKRDALERGLLQLHPFWVQFVTKSGYVFYLRRYTDDKRCVDSSSACIQGASQAHSYALNGLSTARLSDRTAARTSVRHAVLLRTMHNTGRFATSSASALSQPQARLTSH